MTTSLRCTFRRSLAAAAAAALMLGLLALAAPPAWAQTTYTVDLGHITGNSATDDPVPDGCDPGDCSLREAVIDANANPDADTITFEGPGAVSLAQLGAESEATNDLDITEDLTILGTGDSTSITPFEMNFSEERVFDVQDATVVIEDVVFFDGEGNGNGGAIRLDFDSDVTVRRSTFRNNQAPNGGAIANQAGALTVEDSSFDSNNAIYDGGAIFVSEPDAFRVEGTTFLDNTAGMQCCSQEFPQGRGGAIAFNYDASAAPAEIDSSTFVENHAEDGGSPGGDGGAIYSNGAPLAISNTRFEDNGSEETSFGGAINMNSFNGNASTITNTSITNGQAVQSGAGIMAQDGTQLSINQSTISGNELTGADGASGGGIWIGAAFADVDLLNTTVSSNVAGTGGGGIHIGPDNIATFNGEFEETALRLGHVTMADNSGRAGLFLASVLATVESRSTLISNNEVLNCFEPDEPDQLISLDYNLDSRDECNFDQTNDQIETDPTIGDLDDNDGQPQGSPGFEAVGQTHALIEGSPAINTADPGFCPDPTNVDERLVARPQGAGCDIGAYEYQEAFDIEVEKSVSPGTVDTTTDATFTIEVSNTPPSQTGDVVLTDVVPDGLIIGTVTPSAGTCDPPVGQTITCDLGPIAPGETVTITIVVSGPTAGTYVNTATIVVNDGDGDDNPDNDSDDATLIVVEDQVLDECTGGTDEDGEPIITDGITRIEGLNRIQTAIAASQAACDDGDAPAVVLTRADLFPDAQAGTPLAIDLGAPLLLSNPATLDPQTEVEIQRVLDPGGTVYLLGGTVALSDAVDQRLMDLGYTTVRYGGQNRFGTAAIIADDGLDNPPNLLVANGGDFADSVVAGAASVAIDSTSDTVQAAVLLTSDVNVPPETQDYLDGRTGPTPTIIAIGAAAGDAFPAVEEVSGPSRFETAVAVAERFFSNPEAVGIARSDDFADGLTGGALVGRPLIGPGPVILTATDSLPAAVQSYLSDNASTIDVALIFGGTAAVSQSVEDDIASALGLP